MNQAFLPRLEDQPSGANLLSVSLGSMISMVQYRPIKRSTVRESNAALNQSEKLRSASGTKKMELLVPVQYENSPRR